MDKELKTKSGKKAYFTKKEWLEIQFKNLMKTKGIGRKSKQYIFAQEMFFIGAMEAMDNIIPEWVDKIVKQEPI